MLHKISRIVLSLVVTGVMFFSLASFQMVSAQDVWVYSSADGIDYYVMDETAKVRAKTNVGTYQTSLKTVRNNTCVECSQWSFSFDEGYVWVEKDNSGKYFPIHRGHFYAENYKVYDRPELMALLQWFKRTYK